MVRRHELTDAQFATLAPLLPPAKPATGRPNLNHRTVLNGILWRLKTGAPWRDLPERYGNWQTVYSRFRRWQRAGVWARVLAVLQVEGDASGELNRALHFVDGTTVRAHQHAAGAQQKGAPRPGRMTRRSARRWTFVENPPRDRPSATASPSPLS